MVPMFDKDCNHVGWIQKDENIFDINLNWVAYIHKNNIFSSNTLKWLGFLHNKNILDTDGKVIAWNPHNKIEDKLKLLMPFTALKPLITPKVLMKPFAPLKPLLKPLKSQNIWSKLSWDTWTRQ